MVPKITGKWEYMDTKGVSLNETFSAKIGKKKKGTQNKICHTYISLFFTSLLSAYFLF